MLPSFRTGAGARIVPALRLQVLCLPLLASCGAGPAEPVPLAPGVAFELDGQPITVAELDETAGMWGRLDPAASLPHLRQLALTNTLFPLSGARLADPAERELARAAALAARSEIEAAGAEQQAVDAALARHGLEASMVEGTWQKLTPRLWNWALDAGPEELSPLMEQPGSWCFARLHARSGGAAAREIRFRATVYHRGWLDPDRGTATIDERLARATLRPADPSWRDLVPLLWQKKLNTQ